MRLLSSSIATFSLLVLSFASFGQNPMTVFSGGTQASGTSSFGLVLSDPNVASSGYEDWEYAGTDGYGNYYNSYSSVITQNGSGTTFYSSTGWSITGSDGYGNFNLNLNMNQLNTAAPGTYNVTVSDTWSGQSWACTNCFTFTPPPCPVPSSGTATNILNNSALLGWTENGTSSSWDIEWGTSGFTPNGVPDIAATSNNPQLLSGLNSDTQYQFYVRAICDTADLSAWAGPFSFTTARQCNVISGSPQLTNETSFGLLLSDPNVTDGYGYPTDFSVSTDGYGNPYNSYTTTISSGGSALYTSTTETLQSIGSGNYNLNNSMSQNASPSAGSYDVRVHDSYSGNNWACAGCFVFTSPFPMTSNDSCGSAMMIPVADDTTLVTNGNYMNGPAASCSQGAEDDAWLSFTGTGSPVEVYGSVQSSSTDFAMEIWEGCPSSGGTLLYCDDDGNVAPSNLMPYIWMCTDDGTTYYIRYWEYEASDTALVMGITVRNDANYFVSESASICSGNSYAFPDGSIMNNITSQVVHTSVLLADAGCDSLVTTTVDVFDCSCANPNQFSVTDIQLDQATIHWNPHPNATKYKLKIRPVGTSSWTYHTIWAPDTFKVKPNLLAGTDYEYKVKTVCNINSPSGYSGFQYFSTLDICQNPDSVVMNGVNSTQTNAWWTPVPGAISYKLKYRPVGSSNWKYKTVYAPDHFRNLYNLLPDTPYEYKIRTTCASGNVPYGPLEFFNTLGCDIPSNRQESSITPNSAIVSWDPVPGAVSYKVKYRVNNTSTWSYKNVSAPSSSSQLQNLIPATTYQWKVKTFCSPSSNYSSYSGNNLFSTVEFQGGQESRLAFSEDDALDDIIAFPNPTRGAVTLNLGSIEASTCTVRDMTGKVVHRESLVNTSQVDLELTGASGLFTIEVITTDGQRKVFRMLKH